MVKPHEIKEFANRDWSRISDLDRLYWTTRYRENGISSVLDASQALWRHMKSIRPEWPDASQRERDLNHHLIVKELFIRISDDKPPR